MIYKDIRISRKAFEAYCRTFCFVLQLTPVGLQFNIKGFDKEISEQYRILDKEVIELINSVKFDLFSGVGVSKLPKKNKSHSMEVVGMELPD
jgi:hypothetical protein